MNSNLSMNGVSEILASISESLSSANIALERGDDSSWRIQGAFVKMRVFLEAAGLLEALKDVQRIEVDAKNEWGKTAFADEIGEDYLVWGATLYQYLSALKMTLGAPQLGVVTKDVIQILRETEYSITDKNCFPDAPASESEVHARVEAVLRCVFPDLIHKPQIAKQIKQFQPDTGLPSIGTLIEYKFMANHTQAKRIADEILADTRGYLSSEWKSYIYVIYETTRIKSEKQWRQLLRECEVKANTEAIVISGEEPRHSARTGPTTRAASSPTPHP